MEDREFLKALNGIEFDEEEINECLNYEGISIDELKYKSSNLTTKISMDSFEEQKKLVKTMLRPNEKMDCYIKGARVDTLRMAVIIGGTSFKTNDIGFNSSMFVTNERIITCDMNYYNSKVNDFKSHELKDITEIKFNRFGYTTPKDVKKAWGGVVHYTDFYNLWLYVIYITGSFFAIKTFQSVFFALFNMFEIFGGVSGTALSEMSTSSAGDIALVFGVALLGILYLLFRHFTAYKLRVSIKTSDLQYYDFIIVNSDHQYIKKILNKIKKDNGI
ncbi:MAG: PH domain-containing protein [Clostridium sp.]